MDRFALKPQEGKDHYFMGKALVEAKKGFKKDEVPVGAILVVQDQIVATGYNQVESLKDATAHAEMLCLSSASEYFNDWRYEEATLYTTLEPCVMCTGALFSCRIKRVVWGAPDLRLGACGSFVDLFSIKHPMCKVEVTTHVREEECAILLKEFFEQKRNEKKKSACF